MLSGGVWIWRRQYAVDVVCDWFSTILDSLTISKYVEICIMVG
jgi:hypothetical protein